jgi:hypothetical protein
MQLQIQHHRNLIGFGIELFFLEIHRKFLFCENHGTPLLMEPTFFLWLFAERYCPAKFLMDQIWYQSVCLSLYIYILFCQSLQDPGFFISISISISAFLSKHGAFLQAWLDQAPSRNVIKRDISSSGKLYV